MFAPVCCKYDESLQAQRQSRPLLNELHWPAKEIPEIHVSLHPSPPTATQQHRYEALQAGLDLIDQGFTLIDENLCMVAWNSSFLRLLGFPETLVYVGAPFEKFIRFNTDRGEYGDGNPDVYIHERIKVAKAFLPHTMERVRPNGTVLRIHGVPIPGHGFVTLYSDVTEQRRSEKLIRDQNLLLDSRVTERTAELSAMNDQLREALHAKDTITGSLHRSESQMRLITDSIPALVAYFDRKRTYRYVNRGYLDWFGLNPDKPQEVSARAFLGVDTYTRIKPNIMRALRGEAVTFEYELRTIDGRLLVVRTSLIPELAQDGTVAGCFELTFDITKERRSHELLVQAQKMEALGQLTGGLAHDFNNILTVILGNLNALTEHSSAKPYLNNYINPAVDAARRGSKLIQGLLSFARKQPLEASLVDINPLLVTVDQLVRHSLPEAVTLQIRATSAPLIAYIDPHQLQNALLNLILNARDAMEERGEISIHCATKTLDAVLANQMNLAPGRYVEIQVRDDGCGMDAATRSRIFEPFFTTKMQGHGTGLGLAMVYGFAHQSGGTVIIESEPGWGTQVSLWLPEVDAVSAEAPAAPPIFSVYSDPIEQGLALLVDDDQGVRQIVRHLLLELGFSVIEAESGAEALQLIDQTPGIRLLLSDIVMSGGVDGHQVVHHAMARGDIPNIVLMSGNAPQTGNRPDVPFLSKPFTKAQLVATLRLDSP